MLHLIRKMSEFGQKHGTQGPSAPQRRTVSSNMIMRPPAFSAGVSYLDDPKMKHLHGLCAPRQKGLKEARRIIDFSCCKYEIGLFLRFFLKM